MRLFDYISQGGAIMYLLLLMNICGISILLWRFFVIKDFKKKLMANSEELFASFSTDLNITDKVVKKELLEGEIGQRVHGLEYGLNILKIIASIAPLLGLLGTVLGIFTAFKVIAEQGLNDPSLFAGGISMALITTVGGLIVAIPHFIGYNYLIGVLDGIEVELNKLMTIKLFKTEQKV
jgi:biopolymer transport protein ExbB